VPSPNRGFARTANVPRPTRTAAILFGFAILLELLGRLVDSTPITVAAAAALGAVIGDAALTPRIDRVRLVRNCASRMTAGVECTITMIVINKRPRHTKLAPLAVVDDDPSIEPLRLMTPRVGKQPAVLNVPAIPNERGYWAPRTGRNTIEAHSPLGGFVRSRSITISHARWVHPAPAPPVPLPDIALGTATGFTGSGRTGQGLEFYGIREWRSGDAASSVHWRASARRNQLIVMERERPAQTDLVVLAGAASPGAAWEHAVARAASTAIVAIRLGQSVTLIRDLESSTPGASRDILDWFATLGVASTPDHDTVTNALRQLGPGAAVLWLSSTALPPQIRQLSRAAGATTVSVISDQDRRGPR
jgi:uncharacterized protein (DUF58 family)